VRRCTWAYAAAILLAGGALDGFALTGIGGTTTAARLTCLALVVAATFAQFRTVTIGGHFALHLNPVFVFAGVLLLPAGLIVPLVVLPSLVVGLRDHMRGQAGRWRLHVFNSAMYAAMAFGARAIDALVAGGEGVAAGAGSFVPLGAAIAAASAALTFVLLNFAIGGLFLVLSKRLTWRATGLLQRDNIAIELSLAALGSAVAALWQQAPWFVPAVFAPVALMDRALAVPQLRQDVQVDVKTGLATIRHFDARFATELDRARRFSRPLSLLLADLDHFKALNDMHGHLAGDAVLAGIGDVLRATLREHDLAGRFGGEEFAVALPETDAEEAREVAERIRQAVAATVFEGPTGGQPLRVTLSIGVASFPHDGETTAALTRSADVAAYRAKAEGRDRVVCAWMPGPLAEAS
jgi:diguanylate cyclase (GGDEF)-like protein